MSNRSWFKLIGIVTLFGGACLVFALITHLNKDAAKNEVLAKVHKNVSVDASVIEEIKETGGIEEPEQLTDETGIEMMPDDSLQPNADQANISMNELLTSLAIRQEIDETIEMIMKGREVTLGDRFEGTSALQDLTRVEGHLLRGFAGAYYRGDVFHILVTSDELENQIISYFAELPESSYVIHRVEHDMRDLLAAMYEYVMAASEDITSYRVDEHNNQVVITIASDSMADHPSGITTDSGIRILFEVMDRGYYMPLDVNGGSSFPQE